MKETPSSPGRKRGRARDYSLLKGNQTRFRKKGHPGQRGGKRGVKTEDQSWALSDHGAHVAPDAQKRLSDWRLSFLESVRHIYKDTLYQPVKFYVWEFHDEATAYCTEDLGVDATKDKQGMCREGHGVRFTTIQDSGSPSGVRTKAQRRLQLAWAKQFDKRCGRKTLHIQTHEHGKNMQMAVSGSQQVAGDQ